MATKTKAELKSALDTYITTNGIGEITGATRNGYETDVIDSTVGIVGDETVAGVKTFLSSYTIYDNINDINITSGSSSNFIVS